MRTMNITDILLELYTHLLALPQNIKLYNFSFKLISSGIFGIV